LCNRKHSFNGGLKISRSVDIPRRMRLPAMCLRTWREEVSYLTASGY
jgi:hypothetical protein